MPLNTETRAELLKLVPYGLLATKTWLMQNGLQRHSIDNLVKSGQLKPVLPGVYTRPDSPLKWQGVVSALQRMGIDLTVGGLSALEFQGLSHYVPLSDRGTVHLYGRVSLPSWTNRLGLPVRFRRHGTSQLLKPAGADTDNDDFTANLTWGDQSRTLRVSTPERALFEVLEDVPAKISFEHAEQLMQGLTTLSPRRLEKLLQRTKSVKVKRLFFWLADRQRHAWLTKLDPGAVDLGRGKRVLARGGKLDKKYQITVPEEMHG